MHDCPNNPLMLSRY